MNAELRFLEVTNPNSFKSLSSVFEAPYFVPESLIIGSSWFTSGSRGNIFAGMIYCCLF